jgi:retinal rod rhodopsin-sensitive cGMP 3',5'-cyclic phosphodiesterase subunit delta
MADSNNSNDEKVYKEKDYFEKFKSIKEGFTINTMKMKDGSNGKVLWECKGWDLNVEKKTENLPKEILSCAEVIREINFSSAEKIENLELIQNFYLSGELIESSRFHFGFVMPNSTNNWEQIIQAKQEGVLPAEILSGNLNVETFFLTNGNVISKNNIIIYYI